jgi:hypothetical protein
LRVGRFNDSSEQNDVRKSLVRKHSPDLGCARLDFHLQLAPGTLKQPRRLPQWALKHQTRLPFPSYHIGCTISKSTRSYKTYEGTSQILARAVLWYGSAVRGLSPIAQHFSHTQESLRRLILTPEKIWSRYKQRTHHRGAKDSAEEDLLIDNVHPLIHANMFQFIPSLTALRVRQVRLDTFRTGIFSFPDYCSVPACISVRSQFLWGLID